MAASGHSRTHFPQAMQQLEHFFLAAAPFSIFLHKTDTAFSALSTLINLFGQVFTQRPQPVQSPGMIVAREFSIQMALLGHSF